MSEQILDQAATQEILRLSKEAIESSVLHTSGPSAGDIEKVRQAHPILDRPTGAFVTIYVDGHLRGCLGEVETDDPLLEVILRCARKVPRYDYRFPRMTPDELPLLAYKISILSVLRPLASPDEIEIGRDGLIVRAEGHAGLLLPEVPVEYGWDVPTFLHHLWRKAGIPQGVPVEDVRLWSFTSQVLQSAAVSLPAPNP